MIKFVQDVALARAKIYRLLAAIYARPPQSDFLKSMSGWLASIDAGDALLSLPQPMRQSLQRLDNFFKQMEQNPQTLTEAISVEFTRLFRGVKPLYSPLPPYESVYREEGGRVFGELTTSVRLAYLSNGLSLAGGLDNEPPDHISFELEFMSLLCLREAEAWEKDDMEEVQRVKHSQSDFLEEHLLAWLPRFCDEIIKHDKSGLFSSFADLTEGWVEFDYQHNLQMSP